MTKFRLSESKAMLASALQSGRTNGRRPEGKSNSDRRSTRKNFMKTAGGGAIPRLARVMTCLMLMLTGLGTGAWAADTYTVAGSNSAMFGSAWDASNTANDMTKNGDGTYSITYTNVYLDDDVQYKVVKNHSWDEAYPAGNNRVITIAEAGTYTVTICFNPTTHEVYEKKPGYTVSLAEGTEDAENWTVTVGDGGTAQALPVEGLSEGQTVTLTYTGSRRVKSVTAVSEAAAAEAGPNEVLTYSFDDASHPSGLTAGSRVSFDYSRTSVITNSNFLNAYNNTNGDPSATTVSLGDTDLSGETWTLSFEWAACGGCNSKPDHTTLKAGDATLFDLSGNSNWNTTVTIIYTGSDGSKTLPVPGCDKSNRFTAAVGDQYNTTTYWHHIVVTGSAEGVKMTITNSSTGAAVVEDVVLSETNVNPTSLIIEPCCGGGIGIDALSLTYEE